MGGTRNRNIIVSLMVVETNTKLMVLVSAKSYIFAKRTFIFVFIYFLINVAGGIIASLNIIIYFKLK